MYFQTVKYGGRDEYEQMAAIANNLEVDRPPDIVSAARYAHEACARTLGFTSDSSQRVFMRNYRYAFTTGNLQANFI